MFLRTGVSSSYIPIRLGMNDSSTLDYCEDCRAPGRRVGTVEDWQRYGTDPVELLSGWEREQLERLLSAL